MDNEGPFGPIVNGTQIVFYEYRPNKAAGYAFVALFALATLGHLVYLFSLRAWSFIPFILGGIAEVFGYYGRVLSSDRPNVAGPWIQQNLLILASPPFLAATVYMSLGRIATAIGARDNLLISPRFLAPIYVLIDIGCLASQLIGSVLPASGDANAIELSKNIILGGLIAQVVALAVFLLITWHAQSRTARDVPHVLLRNPSLNWKNHFRVIYVIVVLIVVRSVVRTIEYVQGDGGFIISHEVFIYALDAAPMWLVMVIYLVLHPGRLIRDGRRLGDKEGEVMLRDYS
ncbi:RTA1-domain-containing protein [Hypomontagnella monticulosa]|nr:RTA1-domain-containing protein [Hypomontagnella monticulosa]